MVASPRLLAIAETSGLGAGPAADLKTFSVLGADGTAIELTDLPPAELENRLEAYFAAGPCHGVKLGLLPNAAQIEVIGRQLRKHQVDRVVLDPMVMTVDGTRLLDYEALSVLKRDIVLLANLITPNWREASLLVGYPVNHPDQIEKAAEDLLTLGCQAVYLKGDFQYTGLAEDYFVTALGQTEWIKAYRLQGCNTAGAGCIFASAVLTRLARGQMLLPATREACDWVRGTVARASQGHDVLYNWLEP